MPWARFSALLLACASARAQVPADAPLAPPVPIFVGVPAPADGVFMTTAKAADVAQRCRAAELERDSLRDYVTASQAPTLGMAPWVAVFVAGLLVGSGAVLLVRR